jgi:hypothetical protein
MRNRLRTKAARFYPATCLELIAQSLTKRTYGAKDMLEEIRERIEYGRKGLRDSNRARRLQTRIDSVLRDATRSQSKANSIGKSGSE